MNTSHPARLLGAFAAGLVLATGLSAQTTRTVSHSLVPVADSYIRDGAYANVNHGAETTLYVKNSASVGTSRIAYLRFSLAALNRSSVANAQLRLRARNDDNSSATVKIYGLTDDSWSEDTMTWNTGSPNHAGKVVSGNPVLVATLAITSNVYSDYAVNVTPFLNQQMSDKVVSFLLINETVGNTTIVIRSREDLPQTPTLTFDDPVPARVFNPTADAFVRNGSFAGTTHGTGDLHVKTTATPGFSRLSYLQFNRSTLADSVLKRATLRLYAKTVSGGTSGANIQTLYGLDTDDWTEAALTWSESTNHHRDPNTNTLVDISRGARAITGVLSGTAGQDLQVDISNLVNEKLGTSVKQFTIMAMPEPGSPNLNFSSRESADAPVIDAKKNGATQSITAVADTYIRNGIHADANFGTETSLGCSDAGTDLGRVAFFRFDLGSLSVSPGVDPLDEATLTLRVSGAAAGNAFKLYMVDDGTWGRNWVESGAGGITWRTGSKFVDTDATVLRRSDLASTGRMLGKRRVDAIDSYYDFDVTDFVNSQKIVSVDDVLTFMVASEDDSGNITYYGSREDIAARQPELVLEPLSLADNLSPPTDSVLPQNGLLFAWGGYGLVPNLVPYSQSPVLSVGNGYQYAAFYNAARQVCVARRPTGGNSWSVAAIPGYTFESHDNHNNISLGLCPADGTLHIAFDHHKNVLRYSISQPNAATAATWSDSLFNPTQSFLVAGQTLTDVTYPRFILQSDGRLLFAYRHITAGNGDSVLYRYNGSASPGTWSRVGKFVARDGGSRTYEYPDRNGVAQTYVSATRNAYHDSFVYDAAGWLHTSWTWREGAGSKNHDVLYAYSTDHGDTWRASGGTLLATTDSSYIDINDTAAIVAAVNERRSFHNDGGLDVDPLGRVHIVASYNSVETPAEANVRIASLRRYHHHWQDEAGVWRNSALPYLGSRPRLVADRDAAYLVFAQHNRIAIAKATRAAGYTDWSLIRLHPAPGTSRYSSTPGVDLRRFRSDGILSIFTQEEISGATSTPVRVIEFQVN